ncbi:hypothetical protein FA95DRAFT_17673 [Auriscalpium vulgare]|uniref:Uncharacterized protein n=1 Tax=Auriscalpium vulgare TaxID=40419 RepID=A0ACB8SC93_9AGAM|nr:hypothetical protein FA95DRAFT_17673 [Auriscalpium vulgare]
MHCYRCEWEQNDVSVSLRTKKQPSYASTAEARQLGAKMTRTRDARERWHGICLRERRLHCMLLCRAFLLSRAACVLQGTEYIRDGGLLHSRDNYGLCSTMRMSFAPNTYDSGSPDASALYLLNAIRHRHWSYALLHRGDISPCPCHRLLDSYLDSMHLNMIGQMNRLFHLTSVTECQTHMAAFPMVQRNCQLTGTDSIAVMTRDGS